MSQIAWPVFFATLPAAVLAVVTWRVVWLRSKLVARWLPHPCLYFGLALLIGYGR